MFFPACMPTHMIQPFPIWTQPLQTLMWRDKSKFWPQWLNSGYEGYNVPCAGLFFDDSSSLSWAGSTVHMLKALTRGLLLPEFKYKPYSVKGTLFVYTAQMCETTKNKGSKICEPLNHECPINRLESAAWKYIALRNYKEQVCFEHKFALEIWSSLNFHPWS